MKKSVIFAFFMFCVSFLFATDWPVKMTDSSKPANSKSAAVSSPVSIKFNFAEERYGYFSPGFVFSCDETDVTSFADGKLIFMSDAADSYYDDFSSPLGSFVVVAHPDKMISVYANLSEITPDVGDENSVTVGSVLGKIVPDEKIASKTVPDAKKTLLPNGVSESSEAESTEKKLQNLGFHGKNENFEFQVLDTQNKVSINSYLILPPIEKVNVVYPGSIYLENRRGTVYNLDERKVLPSGVYSLYRDFSPGRMPLVTSVAVNGKIISTVNYDMLVSKNGVLLASGRDGFSFDRIFALPKKQFLGEVQFVRGKNEITATVVDFNKNSRKITYYIDMY